MVGKVLELRYSSLVRLPYFPRLFPRYIEQQGKIRVAHGVGLALSFLVSQFGINIGEFLHRCDDAGQDLISGS
jgi:hypothetical protein